MPRETVLIPHSGDGAVAYLALLAYPDPRECDKQESFAIALRLHQLQTRAMEDPTEAWRRQSIEPVLLLLDQRASDKLLDQGIYRLKTHRAIAAEMAAQMLLWEGLGHRLTLRAATKRARHLLGSTPLEWGRQTIQNPSPQNVQHRYWASSKPVLHLAVALRGVIIERHGTGGKVRLDGLLASPAWVAPALRQAEMLRQHMIASASFRGIKDDTTIRAVAR